MEAQRKLLQVFYLERGEEAKELGRSDRRETRDSLHDFYVSVFMNDSSNYG